MPEDRTAEDVLTRRLVGEGSKKGSTWFGRLGDTVMHPPAWAGIAGLLAATGDRGRRAALRGCVCYLGAAATHLPIKLVVRRRHPPGASRHQIGPIAPSFPSGHAAADLAFVFGVAQEWPALFPPLSVCTLAVHRTLVRKRAHYPTDVLAGGALGIAVALAVRKLWPPQRPTDAGPAADEEVAVKDRPTANGQAATR